MISEATRSFVDALVDQAPDDLLLYMDARVRGQKLARSLAVQFGPVNP